MVSKGMGGLPPLHQTPMQQRRFVPGQSARHLSSSLSSSDGSGDEHMSNQANNGSKYLHLVIPSNLHPGQEGNDFEERQCFEERSMARSGCTLDRFGDLGIDESDEGDDEAEVASSEEDDVDASVENVEDDNSNANDDTCMQFEPDVMYDDEGNRIEFMYDDEGNRVEKMDQEDDDIIWQEEVEEEETEKRETTRPNRDGLPPLPPPKRNSGRADIRERFNQTGQSWVRTKELHNQQQQQQQQQHPQSHDQAESSKEKTRKLYLSDSDSTEQESETKQLAALPPIPQKQTSEQRHVRFANVLDTRVFLAEEENEEQEISEDVALEPRKSQARREKASSRIESIRMALEDDAPRVEVEEDEESEVFNTRNFDELEERDEVEAEDESVLNGEMIDFSFLDSPRNASQPQVAQNENKQNSRKPTFTPKAAARTKKSSDLTNLYDGSVGDVGSILNDLQGVEAGRKNVNSALAADDNVDEEEKVSTDILVVDDESDDSFDRETSASPNERDCMELNDDVLRSYQLMKEREEQKLEIELQDAQITHQRKDPVVSAPLKSPNVPKEMLNPRYPYRHGHSLGDEVSDIFTEMSSLGPWTVSKKMDGYNSHSPPNAMESRIDPRKGVLWSSGRSDEDVIPPHQGWVRPDLSLDDSMGDPLVGKMLTLVPSPKANPSMLSTPFEDQDGADNDKAKRRRWPFGKKKKLKDAHASGTAKQQYEEVYDPEYFQQQVEENAVRLHMAADYAALQLIENDQQRRAKKQDMFRQEMEDRAREEEEALRQQEAAVLQAINSGNQDNLAAILSSNSQWAPDPTTAIASDNYTHQRQQKSSSLLQSFVRGELCTSENAKYIEGKAKRIAEVLREAFDEELSDVSDAPGKGYNQKYAYA